MGIKTRKKIVRKKENFVYNFNNLIFRMEQTFLNWSKQKSKWQTFQISNAYVLFPVNLMRRWKLFIIEIHIYYDGKQFIVEKYQIKMKENYWKISHGLFAFKFCYTCSFQLPDDKDDDDVNQFIWRPTNSNFIILSHFI